MSESLQYNLAPLSIARLAKAANVISEALVAGQGIRLGQSAVLSNKVHAFNANSPEHVQIMVNSDAGQVFYYRQDSGRISHLDVFHECGMVDHQVAAKYVRAALETYDNLSRQQPAIMGANLLKPDYVDIQTATGGGRITGRLQGGKKPSVRRVHENHVHVALLLPPDNLICLFYIVAAVETAVMEQGLELRCNECISYVETADSQTDLSPYTDQTDSLLTGEPSKRQGQQARLMSDNTLAPSELLPQCEPSSCSLGSGLPSHMQGRGQNIVGIESSPQGGYLPKQQQGKSKESGYTPCFSAHGLYDSYKQAIRQTKCIAARGRQTLQRYHEVGGKTMLCASQACSAGLDVTATVSAAAERVSTEGIARPLRITAPDLRYNFFRRRQGNDICLLVDCSGSMAGSRLLAARHVAGEISRFGCNRASLLIFQDKQAIVLRTFTASKHLVLNAFAEIIPQGATPLALGIKNALSYIKEQQARKPLLVLITDGIPSKRCDENSQPLTEALSAASEIKQESCRFLCIGLDSEDGFLQKLTASADGVLYLL